MEEEPVTEAYNRDIEKYRAAWFLEGIFLTMTRPSTELRRGIENDEIAGFTVEATDARRFPQRALLISVKLHR